MAVSDDISAYQKAINKAGLFKDTWDLGLSDVFLPSGGTTLSEDGNLNGQHGRDFYFANEVYTKHLQTQYNKLSQDIATLKSMAPQGGKLYEELNKIPLGTPLTITGQWNKSTEAAFEKLLTYLDNETDIEQIISDHGDELQGETRALKNILMDALRDQSGKLHEILRDAYDFNTLHDFPPTVKMKRLLYNGSGTGGMALKLGEHSDNAGDPALGYGMRKLTYDIQTYLISHPELGLITDIGGIRATGIWDSKTEKALEDTVEFHKSSGDKNPLLEGYAKFLTIRKEMNATNAVKEADKALEDHLVKTTTATGFLKKLDNENNNIKAIIALKEYLNNNKAHNGLGATTLTLDGDITDAIFIAALSKQIEYTQTQIAAKLGAGRIDIDGHWGDSLNKGRKIWKDAKQAGLDPNTAKIKELIKDTESDDRKAFIAATGSDFNPDLYALKRHLNQFFANLGNIDMSKVDLNKTDLDKSDLNKMLDLASYYPEGYTPISLNSNMTDPDFIKALNSATKLTQLFMIHRQVALTQLYKDTHPGTTDEDIVFGQINPLGILDDATTKTARKHAADLFTNGALDSNLGLKSRMLLVHEQDKHLTPALEEELRKVQITAQILALQDAFIKQGYKNIQPTGDLSQIEFSKLVREKAAEVQNLAKAKIAATAPSIQNLKIPANASPDERKRLEALKANPQAALNATRNDGFVTKDDGSFDEMNMGQIKILLLAPLPPNAPAKVKEMRQFAKDFTGLANVTHSTMHALIGLDSLDIKGVDPKTAAKDYQIILFKQALVKTGENIGLKSTLTADQIKDTNPEDEAFITLLHEFTVKVQENRHNGKDELAKRYGMTDATKQDMNDQALKHLGKDGLMGEGMKMASEWIIGYDESYIKHTSATKTLLKQMEISELNSSVAMWNAFSVLPEATQLTVNALLTEKDSPKISATEAIASGPAATAKSDPGTKSAVTDPATSAKGGGGSTTPKTAAMSPDDEKAARQKVVENTQIFFGTHPAGGNDGAEELDATTILLLQDSIAEMIGEEPVISKKRDSFFVKGKRVQLEGTKEDFKLGNKGSEQSHAIEKFTGLVRDHYQEKLKDLKDRYIARETDWDDNEEKYLLQSVELDQKQESRLRKTKLFKDDDIAALMMALHNVDSLEDFYNSDDYKEAIKDISATQVKDIIKPAVHDVWQDEKKLRSIPTKPTYKTLGGTGGHSLKYWENKLKKAKIVHQAVALINGHLPDSRAEYGATQPNMPWMDYQVNDRFFRQEDFDRMANGTPAQRWALAQEATERMVAQATKLGIHEDQITQAIFGKYKDPITGKTVHFKPHIDDLEMAFEGLKVPPGFNPHRQSYGPTTYERNKAWADRFGSMTDKQLFRAGQWFHGMKTGYPLQWENPYFKADGKWTYEDALELAGKSPEAMAEFKAIIDDLRDSNNSPFAYYRLVPFYDNDNVNPRREYNQSRDREYLPQERKHIFIEERGLSGLPLTPLPSDDPAAAGDDGSGDAGKPCSTTPDGKKTSDDGKIRGPFTKESEKSNLVSNKPANTGDAFKDNAQNIVPHDNSFAIQVSNKTPAAPEAKTNPKTNT